MFKRLKRNKIRSTATIALIGSVLFLLGGIVAAMLNTRYFILGGLGGLGAAAVIMVKNYMFGAKSLVENLNIDPSMDAKQTNDLKNCVEEIAVASGLKSIPQICVVESDERNAFATGKNKSDATIVVTQGLLKALSREELQCVLAHEMAHIANNDIFFASLLMSLSSAVGSMIHLREWVEERIENKSKEDPFQGLKIIASQAFFFLFGHVFAQTLHMAASKSREFMADAASVIYIRNPAALASALEKMAGEQDRHHSNLPTASLGFLTVTLKDNPTHPPLSQRIEILRKIANRQMTDATAYAQSYAEVTGDTKSLADSEEQVLAQA